MKSVPGAGCAKALAGALLLANHEVGKGRRHQECVLSNDEGGWGRSIAKTPIEIYWNFTRKSMLALLELLVVLLGTHAIVKRLAALLGPLLCLGRDDLFGLLPGCCRRSSDARTNPPVTGDHLCLVCLLRPKKSRHGARCAVAVFAAKCSRNYSQQMQEAIHNRTEECRRATAATTSQPTSTRRDEAQASEIIFNMEKSGTVAQASHGRLSLLRQRMHEANSFGRHAA